MDQTEGKEEKHTLNSVEIKDDNNKAETEGKEEKHKLNSVKIKDDNNKAETEGKEEKHKLNYLNSVEIKNKNKSVEIDCKKKKFFITFPYPYMNGKLHLGHLYSLSKADFFSYFKEMQNYNVLFPFAFHCTGMPIAASAQKLGEELKGKKVDVSVISILKSLGFKGEDLEKFVDPHHWCRVFPPYCIKSLTNFDANIDWRRSFITTEINRYYDSFVRYQFTRLKEMGLVSYGKRYSIYCPIDNQPCLDHDRRKGEGVKPLDVFCLKIKKEVTVLIRVKKEYLPYVDDSLVITNSGIKWILFDIEGNEFVIEEELFLNLQYQVENIKNAREVSLEKFIKVKYEEKVVVPKLNKIKEKRNLYGELWEELEKVENQSLRLVENKFLIKLSIPESMVISRSGGICRVALMDQWFLDYNRAEWKEKARKCIKNMTSTGETRQRLLDGIDWLHRWGFSRSFGLGTKIPFDEENLIDSLSDSTIYMGFYTVKNFLFKDLEGKEEIFSKDFLCYEFWDFIFNGGSKENLEKKFGEISKENEIVKFHIKTAEKARESFSYFYPVDLRVSGKDLITNHLLFYIMNHVAFYGEEFWPRRIFTNGHLLLNSAKMSKSEGNFLTVDQSLRIYGTSATRMCLANCGDLNEDANFEESVANSCLLKLYTLVKTLEERKEKLGGSSMPDFYTDNFLVSTLYRNTKLTVEAYENMVYREVIKYAFYDNLKAIEFYQNLGGMNFEVLDYAYKCIIQLMYPIIPSLSRYMIKLVGGTLTLPVELENFTFDQKFIDSAEYIKKIVSLVLNKHNPRVKISVSGSYFQWKEQCMKFIDSLQGENVKKEILKYSSQMALDFKLKKNKVIVFCMDYLGNKQKYKTRIEEKEILIIFKDYIQKVTKKQIEVSDNESGKAEPFDPYIE